MPRPAPVQRPTPDPDPPAPPPPLPVATPHVSGAAALYAAKWLRIKGSVPTASQIKQAILQSATPTASLNGRCVSNGRLNVAGLLELDPSTLTP